ncbi:malonyl-CoA decarboxylase, mitochondrial isoform X2 [Aplysia californica]|nr:malonyl-CoA decarboxylase, mitochondrial isoform X2 [Aplysia californica]XP_012944700.1 malonyl-CoA decarboxylase, mitochondrial isoform X2 [Aplysia californica]
MQPFATMNSSHVNNGTQVDGSFLASTFSDIDSNLLTSEAKCSSFIEFYKNLDPEKKGPFLCALARSFGFEKETVMGCASGISTAVEKSGASFYVAADRMRTALSPKFKTLFVHIGRVKDGVKFLVDLRADVLNCRMMSHNEMECALYQELNATLKELLMLWFTVGFLNLERITWTSPCDLVQKVSNYEAVHKIRTLEDIKRRLGPYRRCYIFTHNSMPREPVVVLHTALMSEIAASIHSIILSPRYRSLYTEGYPDFYSVETRSPPGLPLTPTNPEPQEPMQGASVPSSSFSASLLDEDKEDPTQISCAVFYSITSTQKGLHGVEMGNYLIKSVVRKLQEEFPHLQKFSSLSPIPGFRDWLLFNVNHNINARNAGEEPQSPILLPEEVTSLRPFKLASQASVLEFFKDQLLTHDWYRDQNVKEVMKGPLLRLCAHYLYVEKRRKLALNPVANFHLSNGAQLFRINFLADTTHRGLQQSCSMMVNYRYFLEFTEYNSRNYVENQQISVSESVLNLLNPQQGGS